MKYVEVDDTFQNTPAPGGYREPRKDGDYGEIYCVNFTA